MIKLLTRAAAAALLLLVFFVELPGPASGQGVGVYRGRRGRRVGSVTLPTPPFNPDAGVLNSRGGQGHDSRKTTRRRSTRHRVRAAGPGTARRRGVRRVRHPRPGRPRVTPGLRR